MVMGTLCCDAFVLEKRKVRGRTTTGLVVKADAAANTRDSDAIDRRIMLKRAKLASS
jgi:hypothetical protein